MQNKPLTNWANFWQTNPEGFNDIMNLSTLYFADKLKKEYPLQKHDCFFDLGCGPGFLINQVVDKVNLVVGTDISEKYIEICDKNFALVKNVHLVKIEAYDFESYSNIILNYNVNKVIMLSVLQYYENIEMVKKLIVSLKNNSNNHKFSLFLCDIIPENHSVISDIASVFYNSLLKKYTLKFLKFLAYAVLSDYTKIKKIGLLKINPIFFTNLANELNIKSTIVKNLTIHSGRYSVLLNFN